MLAVVKMRDDEKVGDIPRSDCDDGDMKTRRDLDRDLESEGSQKEEARHDRNRSGRRGTSWTVEVGIRVGILK